MTASGTGKGPDAVRSLVDEADLSEGAGKPRLFVESAAPDRTVAALREILSKAGGLFDRGVPVRLAHDKIQDGTVAQVLTPDVLTLLTHRVCRPYAIKEKKDGTVREVDVRLPRAFAVMYLDWRGEWHLPPLNGIASAPLLGGSGSILSAEGYDPSTGMWRERVPDLRYLVPDEPSRSDAESALGLLRYRFRTFCFADAELIAADGMAVVDGNRPPGRDESAFLVALLTAVCRPSLHHAPGILFKAAPLSGAGAGKGLLARCIAMLAFGREPHAVTGGIRAEEMEKRITAELIEGSPVLFLDNLNNIALRSDLLASAITERPARVRVLGRSTMMPLNSSALIILTGNGLTVSEDLARRFITVELDPRTEDPESRRFTNDIRAEVMKDRSQLLAAALTIWRWGRQAAALPEGRPLGSFETWCRWVRDPLLALGCVDPADRIAEAKQQDGRRQKTADVFRTWWNLYRDRPLAIRDLDEDLRRLIDPHGRGRQYVAAQLGKLAGTRLAGFLLTRQASAGKWGAATFALEKTAGPDRGPESRNNPPGPLAPDRPHCSDGDTKTGAKDEGGGGRSLDQDVVPQAETHRGHRGHEVENDIVPGANPQTSVGSGGPGVENTTPYAVADADDHSGHRTGTGGVDHTSDDIEEPLETTDPSDDRSPEDPITPMPPMPSGERDERKDELSSEAWSIRL